MSGRFSGYYQDWQKGRFDGHVQQLLAQEKVRPTIAKTAMAERQLTQLHQLVSCPSKPCRSAFGHKLKPWIGYKKQAITKASNGEEQQLRLESDDDAVKIVHHAPVQRTRVFRRILSLSLARSNRLKSEKHVITCHVDGTHDRRYRLERV